MNNKIIKEFEELIEQIKYDLHNSKSDNDRNKHLFRLRQIKTSLKIIKSYKKEILNGEDLQNIKGIGKGTIRRINEILKKGYLKEVSLDNKKENLNKYIEELEQVIGIGKINAIKFASIGIKSVKDLKKKIKSGEIKVNDEIKLGLKYYGKYSTEIPRKEIDKINKYLQKIVLLLDKKMVLQICGSYRREKMVSHDIDILITHKEIIKMNQIKKNKNNLLVKLVNFLKKDKFIIDDITYKNYVTKYMGFCRYNGKKKYPIRRIDIRYFPLESYFSALLHFTGSGNFNKKMRLKAKSLGYKLSEYGLFKLVNDKYKKVRIKSEKHIFDLLDMKYLEPNNR